MFDLSAKTAVVTGAANGIGKAITTLFLERGAQVVATDLAADDLEAAFGSHDRARLVTGDISDDGVQAAVVAAAQEHFGTLDILVNNAGIAIAGDYETLTDAQFDQIMAINVRAVFRLTRLALPLLKQAKRGRVINLGSIMSDVGGPALAIYGASKHAVAGLTKGMAVDFGPHGITANYLQPGAIWTKMSEPFMDDPAFRQYWEEKAPVGRLGEAPEVAMAALFLASDEAQFVSGTGLNVDGGAIVKF
ncbi:MAG: SDR family oxidoreductase [Pseudomonadota bacterium]